MNTDRPVTNSLVKALSTLSELEMAAQDAAKAAQKIHTNRETEAVEAYRTSQIEGFFAHLAWLARTAHASLRPRVDACAAAEDKAGGS